LKGVKLFLAFGFLLSKELLKSDSRRVMMMEEMMNKLEGGFLNGFLRLHIIIIRKCLKNG
jgi:hypothetical protein